MKTDIPKTENPKIMTNFETWKFYIFGQVKPGGGHYPPPPSEALHLMS